MAGRRLSPDESALWARVTATVRAIGRRTVVPAVASVAPEAKPAPIPPVRAVAKSAPSPAKTSARVGETLDGGWDRRLRQGIVAPDRSIDLHGHTLASAHAVLDHALERAIADDARLLLVVTGRPPRVDPRLDRRLARPLAPRGPYRRGARCASATRRGWRAICGVSTAAVNNCCGR